MTAKPLLIADMWWLAAIVIVTTVVSLMFLSMIMPFLIALVLSAIMATMAKPLFLRIKAQVGGRSNLASALSLLVL